MQSRRSWVPAKLTAGYRVVNVDVDGDGLNELVVAYADRVIRAYRWWSTDEAGKTQTTATLVTVDKWLLTGQVEHVCCFIF